jgi:hypothetical protein
MSASTEQLVEKIRAVEQQIATEPHGSRNITMLQEHLLTLQKQLNSANEALTEGKQTLLKG